MNALHFIPNDYDRIAHSIKTAFACLIGFALTKIVHFHVDQWLIITIVVVMCAQLNVGSIILKSYMRFLGTLTGSLIAMITLIFFGHEDTPSAVAIALSAMFFSYLATSTKSYNESGTLGIATVIIILVTKDATVITAIERCLEISLGILIAALISQFVLPIHARDHLRRNQATTIRQLRNYYQTTLLTSHKNDGPENLVILDESIAKTLIAQRKLATEAKREKFGAAFSIYYFNQSLWCEKEILRSIAFMFHAYQASPVSKKILTELPGLTEFHHAICDALEKVAAAIEEQQILQPITIPTIAPLKMALANVAAQEEKIYLDGFVFCMEILIARLTLLVELINELDKPAAERMHSSN